MKLGRVNVLVVGGTRFVGYLLVWRLLARGARVTLFNRGTTPDPFGDAVERVHGDRTSDALAQLLRAHAKRFDAIVDFAAYHPSEVSAVVDAVKAAGADPHYVFVSTGQVYLVRAERRWPAREEDYDGPLMPEPTDDPDEHDEWSYGVEKRACEDVIRRAHASFGFGGTVLRIPMVNGERDHHRRVEGYLWRMLDHGPIVLPGGGEHVTRHVYGADVARLVAAILGRRETFGHAYNLSQDEQPTLVELLELVAGLLGVRPTFVPVPRDAIENAGLRDVAVSPFSGTWMSRLDPTRAKRELAFVHRPLATYLDNVVQAFLSHPPETRPDGYAHRAKELELARRFE
ncbi:NAD-dependent epimerase/dehydratase family protein [Myxococcota bacterium]|nr:NAD-dependent epimerase/dehydratase family protein [Myxococcota bacterium]